MYKKIPLSFIFYYENPPSEDEVDLSEIVVTELYADFIDVSINIHRIVLSLLDSIPEIGLRIFHRKEYWQEILIRRPGRIDILSSG